MQYLVSEVRGKGLYSSGEAKVFNTISDTIRYFHGVSKNKKQLLGGRELNSEVLQELLKERLSTVSVFEERNAQRRWTVSAF